MFSNWCNASSTLGLQWQNEDGARYIFDSSSDNEPCADASDGADMPGTGGAVSGLDFTLTEFANPSGTYTGNFGDAKNGTITLTVNSDFSVSATATLPADSLCPAQATTMNLTTSNPEAINNGWNGTIAGYIAGNVVVLSLADNLGNVTGLIGTDVDANGNQLAPGALFFSGFTSGGVCNGTSYSDAPFHKKGVEVRRVHRHHHRVIPRRFKERLDRDRR